MFNKYRVIILCSVFILGVFLLRCVPGHAQVTGIYTDFIGFWTSGIGDINPIETDNKHHVLAFTYNGINDNLLSGYGI